MKKAIKLVNSLFIAAIIVIFLVSLVRTVFFPKDINYYENRYSEKIILPSVSNIVDMTFQDSIENALADQIPKAQVMKKYYNITITETLRPMVRPILKLRENTYVNYMGLMLFNSDHIMYSCYNTDEKKVFFDAKAENYNSVISSHPELDFYAYYIEKDTDINFESGEKNGAGEYMLSLLHIPENNKAVFEINNYPEFREYFYRTDHHWNYKGSYKAYTELLTLLDITTPPIEHVGEITLTDNFSGSKAASIGSDMFGEDFTVYTFDYPEMSITINGEAATDYGMQDDVFRGVLPENVSYGTYYGGDHGEIIFDSGNADRENILIIGESYDNALLKLLASHFDTTYSIDLRNYEHFMGKLFDLDEYISERDIDKVLFIGNIDFYILNDFMLEER